MDFTIAHFRHRSLVEIHEISSNAVLILQIIDDGRFLPAFDAALFQVLDQ